MGLITYENLADGQKVTANVFNERFAQIIAQLNGNIDENNLSNEGISKEKLKAEVYESMYPVGSMYANFTDPTNPATLLGFGTWTQIAGRVVVGYDATQTEFNAAEKTGGAISHNHGLSAGAAQIGSPLGDSSRLGFRASQNGDLTGSVYNVGSGSPQTPNTRSHNTALTGTTDNASQLPPYTVAYVWKRIS